MLSPRVGRADPGKFDIYLPIVFCHVEGQEESSVITTSESNQESKRNMKEVRKVVSTGSLHAHVCDRVQAKG